jgi:hypothetical protein
MEWYVTHSGTSFGPVTFDQLVEAADAGTLGKDDLIWCTDMQSWKTAAEVMPELWHDPHRLTAPRVWQRSDTHADQSSNRKSAPVKGWLLVMLISLAFVGSALSLAALF